VNSYLCITREMSETEKTPTTPKIQYGGFLGPKKNPRRVEKICTYFLFSRSNRSKNMYIFPPSGNKNSTTGCKTVKLFPPILYMYHFSSKDECLDITSSLLIFHDRGRQPKGVCLSAQLHPGLHPGHVSTNPGSPIH
jgi:hypothetical protein